MYKSESNVALNMSEAFIYCIKDIRCQLFINHSVTKWKLGFLEFYYSYKFTFKCFSVYYQSMFLIKREVIWQTIISKHLPIHRSH